MVGDAAGVGLTSVGVSVGSEVQAKAEFVRCSKLMNPIANNIEEFFMLVQITREEK